MNWPTATFRTPIGVDIGRRFIKAAQMHGRRLAAWTCISRHGDGPLTADEAGQLFAAIARSPFRGRNVVLAAPNDKLLTGIMELPPRASGAPLEVLAKSELARRHDIEADQMEIACWDLPSPARASNRTYMMAIACKHEDSTGLLDLFENNGFNVQAIDVQAAAVARVCGGLLNDVDGTGAILDVGFDASRLVLMYQGVVVYERNLPKCGLATLADESGAGPDTARLFETMAAEMSIPLSYVVNQYPQAAVHRLLLIGGGAGLAGLESFLAGRLGMNVRTVNACDCAQCAPTGNDEAGPSVVAAIGLAQYAA